jgi:hypothetical protein
MWLKSGLVVLLVGCLGVGFMACRRPAAGAISADGYRHATYPYGVIHRPGEAPLPPVWILDNFYVDGSKLRPKEAPNYLIQFHLDTDNDGVVDTIEKGFRYDLSFINQRTGAQIYVRTVPLSYDVANLALDVVARRFTDSLAGGDFAVVEFGFESGFVKTQVVENKRYVTTMESSGPSRMAGAEAYEATIAIRNAEHEQGKDARPDERRRVVFCRPGFTFQPRFGRKVQYPVLLIASYEAMPEKFEEGLPDFERFLDAIAFNGMIGYTGSEAPAATPADAHDASEQGQGEAPPADAVPASSGAPAPPASGAPPPASGAPAPPASGAPPEAPPLSPG